MRLGKASGRGVALEPVVLQAVDVTLSVQPQEQSAGGRTYVIQDGRPVRYRTLSLRRRTATVHAQPHHRDRAIDVFKALHLGEEFPPALEVLLLKKQPNEDPNVLVSNGADSCHDVQCARSTSTKTPDGLAERTNLPLKRALFNGWACRTPQSPKDSTLAEPERLDFAAAAVQHDPQRAAVDHEQRVPRSTPIHARVPGVAIVAERAGRFQGRDE